METAITGGTIARGLADEMAAFRAELLLYGSPEVRQLGEDMLVWIDYQDRYKQLVEQEEAKTRDMETWAALAAQAASETVHPYMEKQAAVMRAELEVLAST